MARFEFRLPDIGEGVHEGEIMAWHVAPGETVVEDAPMVEVMTDKATVTIDVPRAGVIEALRYEVGAVAKVGDVIVVIETNGARAAAREPRDVAPAPPSAPRSEGPVASAVGDIKEGLPGASFFASRKHVPGPTPAAPPAGAAARS